MRRLFAAVMLVLPLSGCIDAELTIDFKDETNVEFATKTLMSSDVAMMSGVPEEQFCQGKPAKREGDALLCEDTRTMTIDALQAELAKEDGDNPLSDLQNAIKVEREDDTVKVTLDFGAGGQVVDEEAKMMAQMMAGNVEQNKIVLNVKGPKIVETTGTLSEDGTTARVEVNLGDLLTGDYPPPFVTTLELKSCTLFIFC